MSTTKIQAFHVIGISVKTSNANGQSAADIGGLWQTFLSQNMAAKIPNKIDDSIYSIYTHYEGDHTQPYKTVLGCKVKSLTDIPEGMTGLSINTSDYQAYTAKGNLNEGVVYQTWAQIWSADLPRTFAADFEVYGAKAQNPNDAEVDIFVGIK